MLKFYMWPKSIILSFIFIFLLVIWKSGNLYSQTTSTFEDLTLQADTFWNGSDRTGGFASGNAYFFNNYTPSASGGYWSGFSYSNKKDTITAGYLNQYSAFTTDGYNGSSNYAVGNGTPSIKLTGDASGKVIQGFYASNTTYAALSMKNGDSFSKKFGGAAGDDKDWFKLTIKGYLHHVLKPDSVEFYLADFRFDDNTADYILNSWEWVDLTSLGNIDSLSFSLSSSDIGEWGMNTPAYFAMDNFGSAAPTSTYFNSTLDALSVFPNPASSHVFISGFPETENPTIIIRDLTGRTVHHQIYSAMTNIHISVGQLDPGIYLLTLQEKNNTWHRQFTKE